METIEMPMSSNVAVTVGSDVGSGSNNFETHESIGEPETIDINEEGEGEEADEGQTSADKILNSAKEDGFEEALMHLADGDFDADESSVSDADVSSVRDDAEDPASNVSETPVRDEVEAEELKDEKKQSAAEGKEKTNEKNPTLGDEQDEEVPAREAVVGRIKDLESQVGNLEEKNKNLFEQVKTLETNNTLAMQTLFEMSLVLHEMLKDEEDNEKKATMLEVLVDMMAQLMRSMFVPEDEKQTAKVTRIAERQQGTIKKSGKKRSITEILSDLREKGAIRTDSQIQQAQPQQGEMAQAA